MCDRPHDDETLDSIAFIGDTLGPLFRQDPSSDTVSELIGAIVAASPEDLAKEWPFAKESEALLALRLIQEGLAIPPELLKQEFNRLFIGPGLKAAPPWGSVYTDYECVTFGASTVALREWMATNGIASNRETDEPEDHIGLMLALMAWIAREKPDIIDGYLRLHLLTWAPHFLHLLEQESRYAYFQGLAQLTSTTLQGMGNCLNLEIEIPHFYR